MCAVTPFSNPLTYIIRADACYFSEFCVNLLLHNFYQRNQPRTLNILIHSSALQVAILTQLAALWASWIAAHFLCFWSWSASHLRCHWFWYLYQTCNCARVYLIVATQAAVQIAKVVRDIIFAHVISESAHTNRPTNRIGKCKAILGPACWAWSMQPAGKC